MHFQQILGLPLYFYNQDWYYAWQALAKQFFSILLVTMTEWWSPTEVRITWDKSVDGQISQNPDGKVKLNFPERMVLISNHQIYTDWVFLWWSAYTAKMHGHIIIILKDSLRFIPLIGPGMILFSFIFLSRHWETDKPRFQHRLKKLKSQHKGPLSGSGLLDPMWLLLFPEGTTLSTTGREASSKWAKKIGVPDLKYALLPRSRGLQFCLEELDGTIEWVYDCTISYEGVP
jgi:lysocardiolipin and lysophospholipid acyltransferase